MKAKELTRKVMEISHKVKSKAENVNFNVISYASSLEFYLFIHFYMYIVEYFLRINMRAVLFKKLNVCFDVPRTMHCPQQ